MGKLCSLAGWAIFAFVLVGTMRECGVRWDFGPQGFNTLVASDGEHYRDHTEIDPLTMALHRSGHEGSIQLAMLGIIGALLAYIAYMIVRTQQRVAKLRQSYRQTIGHEPPAKHVHGERTHA
jgi:hypothetical protein